MKRIWLISAALMLTLALTFGASPAHIVCVEPDYIEYYPDNGLTIPPNSDYLIETGIKSPTARVYDKDGKLILIVHKNGNFEQHEIMKAVKDKLKQDSNK